MRTGFEPVQARSPLRLRLGLVAFGLLWAIAGLTGFAETGHPGWAAVFGVILLLALVDLSVVVHRIRQGPHYQPGRDIPPYPPADDRPPRRPDHPER
jgi:Family of unknown function (DUF6343)